MNFKKVTVNLCLISERQYCIVFSTFAVSWQSVIGVSIEKEYSMSYSGHHMVVLQS